MSDSLVTLREVDPDEKTKGLILAGKLPLFVKFELGIRGHRFIDTQNSGGQKNSIDRLRRIREGTATKADEEIDEYIINSSTRNAKHDPERGIMVSQPTASEPSYDSEILTDDAPYVIDFERSKNSTLQKIVDNKAEAARGYLTVSRENIDWFVPLLPEGTGSDGVSGECLQLLVDKNDFENITAEKQQIPAGLTPEIIRERQLTDARQWLKENPKASKEETAAGLRGLGLPVKGTELYRLLVEFKKMVDRGDQLGLLDRATDPAEKKRIRNCILKRLPKISATPPKKEEK